MARAPVAHIAITTRNRPNTLRRLVDQIKAEANGAATARVHVYDDSSYVRHRVDEVVYDCWYTNFEENHGRDNYWRLVDYVFKDASKYRWDCFFMLPDDVTIEKGFFRSALRLWDLCGKACLSFNTDDRAWSKQWTGFTPERQGELIHTEWMDLCFMAPRTLLENLDWCVKPITKRSGEGSGVGSQLSRRIFLTQVGMYHTAEPLVHHGAHHSQMHPEHRKHNPIIH